MSALTDPGKIITRSELKHAFNFVTLSDVDQFLDLLEKSTENSNYIKVTFILDERVLIFEKNTWDKFIVFMQSLGYSYHPISD